MKKATFEQLSVAVEAATGSVNMTDRKADNNKPTVGCSTEVTVLKLLLFPSTSIIIFLSLIPNSLL